MSAATASRVLVAREVPGELGAHGGVSAAAASRVLVTGGTGAIGGAVVERLCRGGAEVVFTGRNRRRGAALAQRTRAGFVPSDLCEPGAPEAIVEGALGVLGGLDGLVLAAGVLHRAPLSETSDADWDTLLETNVVAPFLLARACLDALADGGGAVVALASGTAEWPEAELGAYSVSKRALLWLTRMLAVEGAVRGVRANAVSPGHTADGMGSSSVLGGGPIDDLARLVPLPPSGRYSTPEDVAGAVAYLLSDAAAGSTGATLAVDGGMLAALRAVRVRQ
ncbi:MAG: SDR family NAD(P)-dependent oxidoreductase [bacterium]|nr:SDR family NAD(P)-dependent oxidoreductase [bacterium]